MYLLVQGPEKLVPAHLEVVFLSYQRGGTYPGIFLYTESARMMRPVTHLATQARVLIGSLEQHILNIRSVLPALSHHSDTTERPFQKRPAFSKFCPGYKFRFNQVQGTMHAKPA